jgi:hypothetical protein
VDTILVEDVLATLPSKTAVMKIDVENLECKVSRGNAGLILDQRYRAASDVRMPMPDW